MSTLLVVPFSAAHSLEALDGRIEAHGFFESQLRVISDDFSHEYDLAQWHQVLNLEIEVDILPDGWGYIDLLSAYVRIEGRYDCLYTQGCGMVQAADTYGDKAKTLPERIASGRQSIYHGAIRLDQIQSRINEFVDTDGDGIEDSTRQRIETTVYDQAIAPNRNVLPLSEIPGFSGIAAQAGADGYTGTAPFGIKGLNDLDIPAVAERSVRSYELNDSGASAQILAFDPDFPDDPLKSGPGDPGGDWALFDDDPFPLAFERFLDLRFAHRGVRGGAAGGLPVAVMGPWLPSNFIYPNAMLADVENPFDATVTSELLTRAGHNGSYYANVAAYGLNFSAGDIDPDDPNTFFENYIYNRTVVDPAGSAIGFTDVQNGALISMSDTSEFPIPLVRPSENPPGFVVTAPKSLGQIYQPPPRDPFLNDNACLFPPCPRPPRYRAIPIAGVGSSVSPNRRGTAKPMRPVPIVDHGRFAEGDSQARGVYLPSRGLRQAIDSGRLDRLPFNIDERDRTWNRGASQDEGELKEAYIDLETWDSRLWLRIGKQNIVWGKTELFRTTDQFNPVDLALVTLGNLEETRIALWSARAVLSLYEVGPFDDVRLEFAANIDDYQSADLGACGEPFAPNPVCAATFGILAHGAFGIGLAGVDFPESPWEDISKIEFGGRIEWRWDRFSFAIADFYGYEDLPYLDRISTYERNVDPLTGRMRVMGSFGADQPCRFQPLALRANAAMGIPMVDDACLQAGPTRRDDLDPGEFIGGVPLNTYLANAALLPLGSDGMPIPALAGHPGVFAGEDPSDPTYSPNNALDASPVNQQFFAAVCAGTVGVSALDPAACAGTIFGSQQALPINANLYRLAPLIGNFLTGSGAKDGMGDPSLGYGALGVQLIAGAAGVNTRDLDSALVKLNRDLGDGEQSGRASSTDQGPRGWGAWKSAAQVGYDDNNFGCVDDALLEQSELTRRNFIDTNGTFFSPFGTKSIPCHSSGSMIDDLGLYLSPEQQAMLGCGPFFGTNCADSGIDLLHAEASVLFQSFPGFEGTADPAGGANFTAGPAGASLPQQWTTNNMKFDGTVLGRRMADDGQDRQQPGTILFRGGPVGTVVVDRDTGEQMVLPGARSAFAFDAEDGTLIANPEYRPMQDGCVGDGALYASLGLTIPTECETSGSPNVPLHALRHPLATTGTQRLAPIGGSDQPQYFRSEMAALSFNFLMLLAVNDGLFDADNPFALCKDSDPDAVLVGPCELDASGKPVPVCSLATPQYCGTVRGLMGLAGLTRNVLRAGGDGTFGRRTFVWQSGGEAVLGFARRNVLGFSGDFAEDFTKSNFSLEATWFNDVPRSSTDTYSGVRNADDYNITLSIDRPTFVNFLNANRTFFFNTQWFFRYRDFSHAPGRWDLLGTFTILAGYFQDRLLPSVTFVYDIRSSTGAVLPQIQYRYTEAFSIVVGAQFFAGRPDVNPISINGLGPVSNEQGPYAYQAQSDVGVSIVRHIDNLFVRLRYSF
ncbi:MAG: DUF1302 family protein [Myxococcota bacterium]|nr:DUF1302 family protein [Myxococcota bacterium]